MLFDATDLPRPPHKVAEGVVHLPAFLTPETQAELVAQARDIAQSVAGTPVAMRRPMVGQHQMKAYLMSLGWFWATNPYRLVREIDGVQVSPVPENYQAIADSVIAAARQLEPGIADVTVETALVNFYPPGAGMGEHVDGEEEAGNPVVSLSIGEETTFRIAGQKVVLMSGDALVFGGPARRAQHSVAPPRAGTGPDYTGLKDGRINITMRQVHPQ
ncbi:alpha-ketoglutarate-dependent dioxygenase AlkB [Corynebacterium sp.]|uniref:alpha-ketoglutarate-dependent dioxygenase AlkB n=1 Tax=Corynebacterium sp. TaxID=1720 RepID=UPI002A91EAB6|nr:alpha-ketoglutarate-dependent dioxygenase AlkB [Corynebacterium sp.]MDY5784667.1 alpha-ketoglutarate-dependent dioxygenase AlkB [Corynebacterium sp.]